MPVNIKNDNTPYKRFVEQDPADVPTAAAGTQNLFIDIGDHLLKLKDDAGDVFLLQFIPDHFELPFLVPDANTNFSTVGDPDSGIGHAMYSTGVVNAEATWNINLPAGTYKIIIAHSKANNRGIYHVYFGATDTGNFDGYAAATSYVVNTITGITVSATGSVAIKIKMEAKNASSSDYYGVIYGIWLVKTG